MATIATIQERAKKLGLTQKRIADELGVSQPAISRLVSGQDRLTLTMARRLAPILSTAPADLMLGQFQEIVRKDDNDRVADVAVKMLKDFYDLLPEEGKSKFAEFLGDSLNRSTGL